MHKIKKYANRKMYDATAKKYISLNGVAELIRAGEDVTVTDNRTGEDLTADIVSRLLTRDRQDPRSVVSPRVLIDLVRKGGGTFSDYAKKYTSLWQSALTLAEDEVDRLVNGLVRNKDLTRSEARRLKSEINGHTEAFKNWVGRRIDRRINEALGVMNLATRDQVTALSARVDRLSADLEKVRRRMARENHAGPKGRDNSG